MACDLGERLVLAAVSVIDRRRGGGDGATAPSKATSWSARRRDVERRPSPCRRRAGCSPRPWAAVRRSRRKLPRLAGVLADDLLVEVAQLGHRRKSLDLAGAPSDESVGLILRVVDAEGSARSRVHAEPSHGRLRRSGCRCGPRTPWSIEDRADVVRMHAVHERRRSTDNSPVAVPTATPSTAASVRVACARTSASCSTTASRPRPWQNSSAAAARVVAPAVRSARFELEGHAVVEMVF